MNHSSRRGIQSWNEDIYEKYMRYELDFYNRYNFATPAFMKPYYDAGTTPLIRHHIESSTQLFFVWMNGRVCTNGPNHRISNSITSKCVECECDGHTKVFCPWKREVFTFCMAMKELGVKFILDLSSIPTSQFPVLRSRTADFSDFSVPLRKNLPPVRKEFSPPIRKGKIMFKTVRKALLSKSKSSARNNAQNDYEPPAVIKNSSHDDVIEKLKAEILSLQQTLDLQKNLKEEKLKKEKEFENMDVLKAENLWLHSTIESQVVLGEDLSRQVVKYQGLLKMLNIPDEFENDNDDEVSSFKRKKLNL